MGKLIIDLIGNTPIVRLSNMFDSSLDKVFAKLEMFNPSGSVKDRAALSMLSAAENAGKLKPGDTIVEYTSGNLGISIAMISSVKNYHCILVTNNVVSKEKINLMRHFGAEVIVGDVMLQRNHPKHPKSILEKLVKDNPSYLFPDQYSNFFNPNVHYETTAPEIWQQMSGEVDVFIATIGTGGTISGVGKYLKERRKSIRVIGVDPEGSILGDFLKTKEIKDGHLWFTEAIGQVDFIPKNVWLEYIDDVVKVSDYEALKGAFDLARKEGISAGWSSGAALMGVTKILDDFKGLNIVTLLPDNSDRYLRKFSSWNYQARAKLLDKKMTILELINAKKERKELFTVERWEVISQVIEKSLKVGISNILVRDGEKLIGKVERIKLVHAVYEEPAIADFPVEFYVENLYPCLDINSDVSNLASIFKTQSRVIITKDGIPLDIITKTDLVSENFLQNTKPKGNLNDKIY